MNRIIITGATGFIGRYMTKKMLENDWEVYAIVRPDSHNKDVLPKDENLHIVEVDIENIDVIVKKVKFADVFMHMAWGGVNREDIDADEVHKKNVSYSLKCLDAACDLECKVFMDTGSRAEYGRVDGIMSETVVCNPITAYGKAKLEFYRQAKEICKKNEITYYHLRIFSVYGCGDHPWSIISTLTKELALGNKVSLSACLHKWNFMHIEDAVVAIYALMMRGILAEDVEQEVVNIASDDTRPLYDFVHEIHRCTGGISILEFGSFQQGKEGALSIIADNTKMVNMIKGYQEKIDFRQGIKMILQYNREVEQGEKNV